MTLEQICKIYCRIEDYELDEAPPSLLERIVDKARLIADMMIKMKSKIKDSNLRNIDSGSLLNGLLEEGKKVKKPHSQFGDEEELKFGGGSG